MCVWVCVQYTHSYDGVELSHGDLLGPLHRLHHLLLMLGERQTDTYTDRQRQRVTETATNPLNSYNWIKKHGYTQDYDLYGQTEGTTTAI